MATLLLLLGIVVVLVVVLASVFVRWVKTEEGNYRAFLWLGSAFYAIVVSDQYVFGPGTAILDKEVVLKGPGVVGTKSVGGGLSVWRIGGVVLYLNFFVKPSQPVSLGVAQVQFSMENVETTEVDEKDPSRRLHIPLGLGVMHRQRVKRPYLRLFNISPGVDVDNEIVASIAQIVRGWTYSKMEREVQSAKGNGEEFWKDITLAGRPPEELLCLPVFDRIREQWGVDIIENTITIKDVRLPPEIQAAEQQRKESELKAKAELAAQVVAAETFAARTTGAEVAMISLWVGKPIATIQQEVSDAVKNNPEHGMEKWLAQYPVIARNWALIGQNVLGVRPTLFGNVDGSPLAPLMDALASLISLVKGGNNPPPAPGDKQGGEPPLPPFRQ